MTFFPSTITAAVLIWGLQILRKPPRHPQLKTAREVCQSTQTSPAQAYEMLARLKAAASDLTKPPGRPPSQEKGSHESLCPLLIATRDFLMDTPGAVCGSASRRVYHDSYRQFVLHQMEDGNPGSRLTIELVADAVGVPLGTLKQWISTRQDSDNQAESDPPGSRQASPKAAPPQDGPSLEIPNPKIATVLREFRRWQGGFLAFCQYLRDQHRLPYGNTHISSVLETAALRTPKRRKGRSRPWSEGTYERFFPGAQWVGDGKQLVICWRGTPMVFNLEAFIDPASDAILGVKVTDTENEAAVLETYLRARATTGQDPLALTLDNRDSNHTQDIKDTIAPAKLLRSTLASPTSKAPIEGYFGLFSQTAPTLVVTGETEHDQARSVLELVSLVFAWKRNHKPRPRLGGLSPAQAYAEASPTEEDIARAKEAILRLERKQEELRRTREAKADPVRRQLLLENLEHLGIQNASALATQLATFSREAIVRGLAVFRAKKEQGTIPSGASDGRYLGGIIRNIHAQLEDELVANHLLELRLRQKEIGLAFLTSQMEDIRRKSSRDRLPLRLVERALEAVPLLDFRFWKQRAVEAVGVLPVQEARSAYQLMVRTITRSFKVQRNRRVDLIAALSAFAALAAPG